MIMLDRDPNQDPCLCKEYNGRMQEPNAPIGVFDSGVGGLSVLKAIRERLAAEPVVYVADQAHVPYGPRPLEQVRAFSESIVRFLLDQKCKLIVVACNTASAAALHHLRKTFTNVPIVGMEPAVKPAAEHTHTGVVGVLATPATFQGALYASVVERFANGVTLLQDTCPGLVAQIEAGNLNTPDTREILENALRPMLTRNIDTVVLGCTHYPFVIPLIQQIAGAQVRVIDPAPAIARQVERLLEQEDKLEKGLLAGKVRFYTTGQPEIMSALLPLLLGETGEVSHLVWDIRGQLVEKPA